MSPQPAYISLGSNIQPEHHLPRARRLLQERCELVRSSSVYRSSALGRRRAPDFLNAVVEVRADAEPMVVKQELLRPIEAELGRVRTADRNAPRTIDLDLVLYGDRIVHDAATGLELPDPQITQWPHLAVPLAEIAPDLRLPGDGRSLRQIAATLNPSGAIRRVELSDWVRVEPGSSASGA